MFKSHALTVAVFAAVGVVVAGMVFIQSPRLYEGRMQLLIADEAAPEGFSADVEAILSTSRSMGSSTEVDILRTQGAFFQAVQKTASERNMPQLVQQEEFLKLYTMYEVRGGQRSRVAEVLVKAGTPEAASEIANNVAFVYNDLRQRSAQASIVDATEYLEQQLKASKAELDQAEMQLKEFKERLQITDLQTKGGQLASYEATLIQQLDEARTGLRMIEAEMTAQRRNLSMLPQRVEASISEIKSPIVQQIETEIAQYERQRTELLRNYNENSTRIGQVDDLIAQTQRRLVDAQKDTWQKTQRTYQPEPIRVNMEQALAQNTVARQSLQRRVAGLEQALNQQRAQIRALPADEVRLAQLSRDYTLHDSKYQRVRTMLEELRHRSKAGFRQAQILYLAQPNPAPVYPELPKLLLIGIVAGGCFGLLLAFARESLRTTVQSSSELGTLLGLPVAATSPMLPPARAKSRLRSLPSGGFRPEESFRYMAFSMLSKNGSSPRRVMFTGVGGAVGCSTSAGQFAIAAARAGHRVILVDCDLRHHTLTRVFEATEKSGLSDILARRMLPGEDTEMYLGTEHGNLLLVPAGTPDEDGISEVPVAHISGLLDALQEKADLVVLDAPPCDAVSDAIRFVQYVDEVCLVSSARFTPYRNTALAQELLQRAGAQSVQLVVTGTAPEEEAYSRRNNYYRNPRRE
jgi:polysaccharide biosynthesis transport protein